MAENNLEEISSCQVDHLKVRLFKNKAEMGKAAAFEVADRMKEMLRGKNMINMVFAAAPSQDSFLRFLIDVDGLDWNRVRAFHLDEYLGLPKKADQKFENYLKDHIFEKVNMGEIYYIDDPNLNSPEQKCNRYEDLLEKYPVDIACLGIGENGHIAFNDPPVADFDDLQSVKVVELDSRCRQQQVNDGCFDTIQDVPKKAITMTIPEIMKARYIPCVVPGPTKREAVRCTLEGPINTQCPASVLRRHSDATLFIDREAADYLEEFCCY